MAFKLNNKILPSDTPFTANGINYPANWLRLSTSDEKKAIGITEVAEAPWYDQEFYWGVDKPKDLANLKKEWIHRQKQQASSMLSDYDWYVIRKLDKGTAIPSSIQTYRDQIRSICTTRENEINGASDVEALIKVIESTITTWPKDPNDTL